MIGRKCKGCGKSIFHNLYDGLCSNCYKGDITEEDLQLKKFQQDTKGGITIIDAKVVGLCSKCRKEDDEIPRYKDKTIILDEDISCLNKAFGKCNQDTLDALCKCGHDKWEHTEKDKPTRCMHGNGFSCNCKEFQDQSKGVTEGKKNG